MAAADFLSHYLNGSLPYVRCQFLYASTSLSYQSNFYILHPSPTNPVSTYYFTLLPIQFLHITSLSYQSNFYILLLPSPTNPVFTYYYFPLIPVQFLHITSLSYQSNFYILLLHSSTNPIFTYYYFHLQPIQFLHIITSLFYQSNFYILLPSPTNPIFTYYFPLQPIQVLHITSLSNQSSFYILLPSPTREREIERNVSFNDAVNTFYLRLYGIRYMVKDHSDSEKGNPLPPHRLLLSINGKGSFICTIPQTG